MAEDEIVDTTVADDGTGEPTTENNEQSTELSLDNIVDKNMQEFGLQEDGTTAVTPTATPEAEAALKEIGDLFGEEAQKAIATLPAEGQTAVNNLIDQFAAVAHMQAQKHNETEMKLAEFTAKTLPVYQRRVDTVKAMIPRPDGTPAFDNVDEYHDYLEQFDNEYGRNPEAAIAHLLYGRVGGKPLEKGEDGKYIDPNYTSTLFGKIFDEYVKIDQQVKLLAQNPAMMASIQQKAELERQAKYAQNYQTIEEDEKNNAVNMLYQKAIDLFAAEKDTNGNLTHPFFDLVKEEMEKLSEKLEEDDYQKLYDMAVYSNPNLRTKAVQQQATSTPAKNAKYRPLGNSIASGVKAKKTGINNKIKKPLTAEDAVNSALEKMGLDDNLEPMGI